MKRSARTAPAATRQAVGYVRVSTEGQASEGASLTAQRQAIEQWAESRGFALPVVYTDAGLSGKDAARPELRKALDAVCAGKGALVCYSLSRLSRSVPDAYDIAKRLRKADADLVSVTESIDTATAMGTAFFGFLAVLAQLERELISERTKSVLAHKKASGKRVGTIPFGYKVGADGKTLLIDTQEVKTLRLIHTLRNRGLKLREVADELKKRGIRNRAGNEWSLVAVSELARRPLPSTNGRICRG